MYCPNCGKGENAPDTYCRNCGEFLTDFSGNASLINRILGANTPDKRVNISLVFDVLTLISSIFLLFFLFGYFDGRYARTGEAAPTIIYLVYFFLGLFALWQFLSLFIGVMHKRKLSDRKKAATEADSEINADTALPPREAVVGKYLPPADAKNIAAPAVTEQTTRNLDKVTRK
ncbi:MAG TPA: hypothetical protein VF599_19535 [Pyrinomonadaceae bacterium]|jgi:hypothetical protein